jgi:proteic killer suppression protein
MIKTFRHKGIELFFTTGTKSGIQAKHADRLEVMLGVLDAATEPKDMSAPGWKLHPLSGKNPKGQSVKNHWAVSVSGNWRLTFTFEGKDAILIDYQDYH